MLQARNITCGPVVSDCYPILAGKPRESCHETAALKSKQLMIQDLVLGESAGSVHTGYRARALGTLCDLFASDSLRIAAHLTA